MSEPWINPIAIGNLLESFRANLDDGAEWVASCRDDEGFDEDTWIMEAVSDSISNYSDEEVYVLWSALCEDNQRSAGASLRDAMRNAVWFYAQKYVSSALGNL